MRFAAIHKTSSYLMVACALIPLALSGELPTAILVITLLGGIGSWFFEPSRRQIAHRTAWSVGWNVALIATAAWSVGEWLRGEGYLTCLAEGLCLGLVNKLWNRRTSKDYLYAYLISFFMLIAGTMLNTGIVYCVAFVGYVVFATWTLTMFHLRREMEENYLLKHSDDASSERVAVERILNSRRVVGGSFLAATALIAVGIFAVSSVIFFSIPRVELGLMRGRRPGQLVTGFGDRIELGHHGLLVDNTQIVARIEFPTGRPRESLHLRGVSFDRYAHGSWSRTDGVRAELPRKLGVHLVLPVTVVDKGHLSLAGTLRQEVYLEPLDTALLFGASLPVAVALPPPGGGLVARVEGTMSSEVYVNTLDVAGRAQPIASGRRYTIYSRTHNPPRATLEAATDLDDEERVALGRYLTLPADLPPRVTALARSITAGATTPMAKINAVQTYLLHNYTYSRQLGRDERYEPLEDFLFVEKRGHCEYFATAMAVLLRAVGVPSRSVNGFHDGEWNSYGNYLTVRQSDAHSWVEVWLGDAGWVTFDPTPSAPARSGGPSVFERARQLADSVQMAWFKYVIEWDMGKQIDMLATLRGWLGVSTGGDAHGVSWRRWPAAHPYATGVGAGTLTLGGLALVRLLLRRRKVSRAAGARAKAPRRALQAIERAARALATRGIERRPDETWSELSRRATAAGDPGAVAFAELVERYHAVRFGGLASDGDALTRLAEEVIRAAAVH